MKRIIYNGYEIIVQVKQNKNMYLKITDNNEPLLIIPYGTHRDVINNFLKEALPKIIKVIDNRKLKLKWHFGQKAFIYICGIKYDIKTKIIESNKRTKFLKQNNILNIELPEGKLLNKEVFKFLKKEAYKLQKPIMDEWSNKMNLSYKSLKINMSKTRWGSCNVKTKDINLSVRLYLEPLASQVYVIVHELAHIEVPNHSKDFWYKVEEFLPDYKKYSKILKY